MYVIAFPAIDPVLVQVGPFAIRWYALAYIAGIVIAWQMMMRMATWPGAKYTRNDADDALLWMTAGVILGGRLGYVLFYKPLYFLSHPLEIAQVWQGGMSFHGGMLGVVLATILFTRRRKIPLLNFGDRLALVAPVGLFFGRIANFINGELWGRPSEAPWAMIFPSGGPWPRHPSQLYQAALEGVVLLAVLWTLRRLPVARNDGFLTGAFLTGYGVARIIGELFREPDGHLGFLFAHITMGQVLSLPMVLIGLAIIAWALRGRTRGAA